MSTQTQSATQNALNRILELIREIVEKSVNGNCIYRGEPDHYDKVSSNFYRMYPGGFDPDASTNLEVLRQETLRNAQQYIQDDTIDDFGLLTELQHYGSQTDLIDFTTDYHIALFFACNDSHDKDGRIVVLKRTEDIDEKYRVQQPLRPLNRVKAQKSIFTQPHKGFIDHNDLITITVPANLKQWILIYLRLSENISTQSLYNDLYGFIQDKHVRYSREASLPLVLAELQLKHIADNNLSVEEKQSTYQEVIEHYIEALQYSPYNVKLYVDQGKCYLDVNQYDCAIEACSKALLLHPNYFEAYVCRGLAFFHKKDYRSTIEDFDYIIEASPENTMVYIFRGIAFLHLQEWEKAKLDFEAAKEMSETITILFRQDSQSILDFEQKYNVRLPADIAALIK